VTSGEENEEVLYSHRAKLYRYADKEWKERGLGDVKVLKNRANGFCRLLMRREQVLKICLNHYLTADISFKPYSATDQKTWMWAAKDYSDEEGPKEEKFALRSVLFIRYKFKLCKVRHESCIKTIKTNVSRIELSSLLKGSELLDSKSNIGPSRTWPFNQGSLSELICTFFFFFLNLI
jgi:hypothetical protein